ncbi:NB-ARC domain-containing protein [Dactylosporangium sp. NPDC049140]|uniref:NB-ARC domain-containing protein n=1 Tax=Dactylosporangium sp. NPDC049140 TaxID=3155647 RepID=UPI0033FCF828
MAVPVSEQRKLFQRSGDMCAFPGCRAALTAEASGADRVAALGEMAHIVGESPNGPRGGSPLTRAERDRYENLVLLCGHHHELVDSQPHTWTVEELHAMKAAHETWVRRRLGGVDAAGRRAGAGSPWMVPEPVRLLVERPEDRQRLAGLVLEDGRGAVVAVAGAGGFGKTTLVAQVCHQVRDAFPGGVLWVAVGEQVLERALAEKVNDLSELVGGARPALSDPAAAGHRLAALLAGRPPTLLVVDDVWTASQLAPFLHGDARVVATSRSRGALPANARVHTLRPLGPALSRSLLRLGVPGLTDTEPLVRRTGGWPILLALANGAIQRSVEDGLTPDAAAGLVAEQLHTDGPDSLDLDSADRRDHAVQATVDASLRRLDADARDRFLELGVFAEDADVPVYVVQVLWAASGTPARVARRLIRTLADLALVSVAGEALRLHDVLRAHLRQMLGPEGLAAANRRLVEAVRAEADTDRTAVAGYARVYLADHAADAGMLDELLLDAGYLLTAWAPGLLARLSAVRTEAGRAAALAYRRAVHHFRDRPTPDWPAYLELAARQAGAPDLADDAGRRAVTSRWRCRWTDWYVEPPHTILTRHPGPVIDVAVLPRPDGRLLVASLDGDQIRVFDGQRGTVADLPWRLPPDHVPTALTCVALPGGDHAFLVGTDHGHALAWHAGTGERLPWDLPFDPERPQPAADPWDDANPPPPPPPAPEAVDPWDDSAPTPPARAWLAGTPEPGELDWSTEPPDEELPAPARWRPVAPPEPDEPDDPEPGTDDYVDDLIDQEPFEPDTGVPDKDTWTTRHPPEPRIRWFESDGPILRIVRRRSVWAVDTRTGRRAAGPDDVAAGQGQLVTRLPDGGRVSGFTDGSIEIAGRPGTPATVVDVHAGPVQALGAGRAPDGRALLATGGHDDGTVRLWEVGDLVEYGRRTRPTAVERLAAAGGIVAAAHGGPVIQVWAGGRVERELVHERRVTALFAAGDVVLAGGAGGPPRAWNPATGERIDSGLGGVTGRVVACAATPDGAVLITTDETSVRAWDVVDGRPRWHLDARGADVISLPDGGLLIRDDYDRYRCGDPATGRTTGLRAGELIPEWSSKTGTAKHLDQALAVLFTGRGVRERAGAERRPGSRRPDRGYRYGNDLQAVHATLVRLSDGATLAALGGRALRLRRPHADESTWGSERTVWYDWHTLSDVHLDTPVTALAADGDELVVGTARGLARLRMRVEPPV